MRLHHLAAAAAALFLAAQAQAQIIYTPPRDYSIPSFTLTFDLPIEHSASWWSLAYDRPEWLNDPANYNMRWIGSLTFTPPYYGWMTETEFTLTSNRTDPLLRGINAYVSGFYGPGVEAHGVEGDYPNGYATLGVYWPQGGDYANQEVRLPFPEVAAIPEPETYALLGAGLLLLTKVTRRRQRASAARD